METDDDYLYVGTLHPEPIDFILTKNRFLKWNITIDILKGQGQLWRYDKNKWEQINKNGFGDEYDLGIREMKVYNNSLIIGTMNLDKGCEMWKYNI